MVVASGFSVLKVVLAVLCALLGAFLWAAVKGNGQTYERAKTLYLQNSGKGGHIVLHIVLTGNQDLLLAQNSFPAP